MKSYKWYWILAIIFTSFAFISPVLFSGVDYNHFGSTTGFIGDTIGGLTAPFLSLTGSILVFAALKAQIDANKAVQEQFRAQQKENDKRDLEQKLVRLFDLHLEIVRSSQILSKQLKTENPDADYPFTTIIGIEYHMHIDQLLEQHNFLIGHQLYEESMSLFEWTLFDGANSSKYASKHDEVVSIALNFYMAKMWEVVYRYFNNVFYVIQSIELSELHNELEKKDLINLYLNHFSYSEIKWLFWISFHQDYTKYQSVLEKYQCFNRINSGDLISKGYWGFPEKYAHLKARFDEMQLRNS